MNQRMVDTATKSLGQVDAGALGARRDASGYGPGDRYVRDLLKKSGRPVILGHQQDRPRAEAEDPARSSSSYGRLLDFAEIVPVSAQTGDNVDRLDRRCSSRHLPEGEPLYPEDFLTDQPERFFVARDGPRAASCAKTREEIPYYDGRADRLLQGRAAGSCASRPPSSSSATSQKGILIGKGGEHAEGHRHATRAGRSRSSWAPRSSSASS